MVIKVPLVPLIPSPATAASAVSPRSNNLFESRLRPAVSLRHVGSEVYPAPGLGGKQACADCAGFFGLGWDGKLSQREELLQRPTAWPTPNPGLSSRSVLMAACSRRSSV